MITNLLANMHEPLLIGLVLLLSTLAYQYLDALRMLRRQAFLSHVYRPEGSIRRWFWDSLLLRIVYSVFAVVAALLALLFTTHMQMLDWWVLAAGILSFVAISRIIHHLLVQETQPQFHAIIVLRMSAWMNVLVMALVLAVLQIIWLEVPDTRHLGFTEMLANSWQESSSISAKVPLFGWLLSVSALLHDATWHVLQQASRVEAGAGVKLSAWLLVLFINALKLGSVQLIVLGIASIVLQARQNGWPHTRKRIFRRSYLLTLLVLFVVYIVISRVQWNQIAAQLQPKSDNESSQQVVQDPCAGPTGELQRRREQEALQGELQARLAVQQTAANRRMEQYIAETVAHAYRHAESGVDAFLDWNFSIRGQYQQLGYLAASTAGSGMSEGSVRFSEYLGAQMNSYISEPLAPALTAAHADIQQVFMAEIQSSGLAYNRLLNQLVAQSNCISAPEFSFRPSNYIDKSLVGLGVAGGAIALRFATAAGTRAATRAGVRRAIAALFTRGAARAGAVGSGSAGAFCGPAFWLCTPAIIAGTWFSIDYGLNKTDELLNREQMRAEMLASLAEDQQQAAAELAEFYLFALNDFYRELEETQQRQFNIRRDGL
ncbi:hypothetical protein [Aliidiomarina sp.]|uniref:hypothetical protein n=1 Tax=Aliidiomarina sp. TaxID=1872439 RepID=UPI003A4E2A5F